jgi:hypothetical protein
MSLAFAGLTTPGACSMVVVGASRSFSGALKRFAFTATYAGVVLSSFTST